MIYHYILCIHNHTYIINIHIIYILYIYVYSIYIYDYICIVYIYIYNHTIMYVYIYIYVHRYRSAMITRSHPNFRSIAGLVDSGLKDGRRRWRPLINGGLELGKSWCCFSYVSYVMFDFRTGHFSKHQSICKWRSDKSLNNLRWSIAEAPVAQCRDEIAYDWDHTMRVFSFLVGMGFESIRLV